LLSLVIEIALKIVFPKFVNVNVKQSNPITGLDRPRGFQEFEVPIFQDIRYMQVVSPTPAAFTPRKYFWNSFL
jgi:hypothetical protein